MVHGSAEPTEVEDAVLINSMMTSLDFQHLVKETFLTVHDIIHRTLLTEWFDSQIMLHRPEHEPCAIRASTWSTIRREMLERRTMPGFYLQAHFTSIRTGALRGVGVDVSTYEGEEALLLHGAMRDDAFSRANRPEWMPGWVQAAPRNGQLLEGPLVPRALRLTHDNLQRWRLWGDAGIDDLQAPGDPGAQDEGLDDDIVFRGRGRAAAPIMPEQASDIETARAVAGVGLEDVKGSGGCGSQ